MRLTTWNVNGIRNPFSYPPWNTSRSFSSMFDILGSDIIVMQELKIQRKDLSDDMVLIDGWDAYFSLPKHKKGYSGVGIYTRNATCAPIRAEEGLLGVLAGPNGTPYNELPAEEAIGGYPTDEQVEKLGVNPALLDAEGRCLLLEFPAFVLLGVYSPANSNGMRDDFRYGFITALDCRIRNLARLGKRVVLVGDLNVSRDELDTAGALEDCRKEGLTHEDYISTPNRRIFNQLLVGGEVVGERDQGREVGVLWDTTRGFHPGRKGMYTHWEQKKNARPGNFGGRIDFVLVAESMKSWIKAADIQEGLLGSDHCPVYADFNDTIALGEGEVKLLDIMNPPGYFEDGERRREWKVQDVPAFSAKKMPEFDRRRSIKSMFSAPSVKKTESMDASFIPTQNGGAHTDSTLSSKHAHAAAETTGSLSQPTDHEAERSPLKRKVSTTPKEKPKKRLKSESTAPITKGQQSLKGFFHSQNKSASGISRSSEQAEMAQVNGVVGHDAEVEDITTAAAAAPTPLSQHATKITPPPDKTTPTKTTPQPPQPSPTQSFSTTTSPTPSQVSAQIESTEQIQRSWGQLFSRPIAPLCEGHNEPCKSMLTKKKGSNQGRSFWMCARPLGPSGAKERGTGWRCGTFIWCSDWKGDGGGAGGGQKGV